jgi:hypothetical protein
LLALKQPSTSRSFGLIAISGKEHASMALSLVTDAKSAPMPNSGLVWFSVTIL